VEARLWQLLPDDFAGVDLSPVTPLGTSSALGPVSQHKVISTTRDTEVVSDPTNVLALEAAVRRRSTPGTAHLAACHRVLRGQPFTALGAYQHFRLFALASSARDRGSALTEAALLTAHLRFWAQALGGLLPGHRMRISYTTFSSAPLAERIRDTVMPSLWPLPPNVTVDEDPARERARGYYERGALRIAADDGEVGDGGFTSWTAQLLSDAKERCLISCVATERLTALGLPVRQATPASRCRSSVCLRYLIRGGFVGNADAVIAALRSGHDSLASFVRGLSDDDLAKPTGAAEWDVSQVLSHLGSGAEINQATLRAAIDGQPNPIAAGFAQSVWARWDAAGRRERLDWFLRENEALVSLYESLAPRDDLRIDLGFVPVPVDLLTAGQFRLNEFTLHTWDVRAGFDASTTLAADAVPLIGPVAGQLAGRLGKTEPLGGKKAVIAVTTTAPDSAFTLDLGDEAVSLADDPPVQPDGTLTLPAEAWVRLVTGRLRPQYTPPGISATGPADLDVLRQVFPGF
jgi:uncharacterized protein (TIGR03083 family)